MKRIAILATLFLFLTASASAAQIPKQRECVSIQFKKAPDTVAPDASPTFVVEYSMDKEYLGQLGLLDIPYNQCPDDLDAPKRTSDDFQIILMEGSVEEGHRFQFNDDLKEQYIDIVEEGRLTNPTGEFSGARGSDASVWKISKNQGYNTIQYEFPESHREESFRQLFGDKFTFAVIAQYKRRNYLSDKAEVVAAKTVQVEGGDSAASNSGDGTQPGTGHSRYDGPRSGSSSNVGLSSFNLVLDISCSMSGGWNCNVKVKNVEASAGSTGGSNTGGGTTTPSTGDTETSGETDSTGDGDSGGAWRNIFGGIN